MANASSIESRAGREDVSDVTPFQWRVYRLLNQIPKGKVTTYGAIARALKSSPRAVGNALRNNPFAPHVPCHRCVAASGYINGYDGEVIEKRSFKKNGKAKIDGKSHQSQARGAKARMQNGVNEGSAKTSKASGNNTRKKLELLKDEGVDFDAKGMLLNRRQVTFDGPWTITE